MKIKTALGALALMAFSTAALAQGCPHEKQITASSCAEGMVWDMAKGTCVLQPTS
jgi:hypothetical protein